MPAKLRHMATTPSPDESEELKKYREALQAEWNTQAASSDLVRAAKKARADLLGLVPDSIVALRAILSSSENEKTRLDTAKFILSYTIGDKAKVVMPKELAGGIAFDELEVLFSDLGADKDEIPKAGDH